MHPASRGVLSRIIDAGRCGAFFVECAVESPAGRRFLKDADGSEDIAMVSHREGNDGVFFRAGIVLLAVP